MDQSCHWIGCQDNLQQCQQGVFFDKLKDQINFLKEKIDDHKEGDLNKCDKEMMSEEVMFFNCCASPDMWLHLLSVANMNLPTGEDKVTPRELELTICLLCTLSAHNLLLECTANHPDMCPLITNVLDSFVGGRNRAWAISKAALDCAKMMGKTCNETWGVPPQSNKEMQKLECLVSDHCLGIGFKAGATDVTLDDDKMRVLHSWISALLGWVQSKGIKSFGPANNVMVAFPMGLFWPVLWWHMESHPGFNATFSSSAL